MASGVLAASAESRIGAATVASVVALGEDTSAAATEVPSANASIAANQMPEIRRKVTKVTPNPNSKQQFSRTSPCNSPGKRGVCDVRVVGFGYGALDYLRWKIMCF